MRGLPWGVARRDGAETAIPGEARRSGAADEGRRLVGVDPQAVPLERLTEVPDGDVPGALTLNFKQLVEHWHAVNGQVLNS